MAEKDKRYYWLKLKKDFFKRHDIQIIENMPNGKDYILFYLKLLCESVDHDGNLRFSEQIPYNENMLATITNTNVDVVRSAINVFSELRMMEIMDDGTYYMSEVNKMLGSETYWAQKKREQKEKKAVPIIDVGKIPIESNQFPTCPSKSIEKEKDIDKELYISIVEYLNQKAKTNFKHSTKKTKTCIHARIEEGFAFDDFKTVIDKKCAEWLGNEKMEKFLRPETLFGTKFEGYLNQKVTRKTVPVNDQNDLDEFF